jgi:hypothetical protein
MWKKSFVATTVALGDGVDDAIAALDGGASGPSLGAAANELIDHLRAPQRATRAAALAKAVRDIVLAIDESTLR